MPAALTSPAARIVHPHWVASVLLAFFCSNAGTFLQTTAQAWIVWNLTNDPRFLGLLGLVQATPLLGISLFGGMLADRFPRRSLLLLTQCTLAAVAAAMGGVALAGGLTPTRLLGLAGLLAAAAAVDNPIRQVYLPGVVATAHRGRVVGLNALSYNAGAVVGPALAGLLLPRVGAGWLFLANAASYLLVVALLLPGPGGQPERRGMGTLAEVLRFAARQPSVRDLLLMVGAVSLLGRSYVYVLPAVAAAAWGGGATLYGTLAALPGVGAVVAATVVAWLLGRARHSRLDALGALALGALVMGLGLAPNALAAAGDLLLIGAAATGTMTLLNAGLQLSTPDGLRGRVVSLYAWLAAGMPALGGWLLGTLMAALGPPLTLVVAGVTLVALALLAGFPRRDGKSGR